MTEKYVKPQIIFEEFSLNTSIAAGCELKTPLASSAENCGYPIRGGVVFVNGADCTIEQDAYNGFCYHVPTEQSNLFNS